MAEDSAAGEKTTLKHAREEEEAKAEADEERPAKKQAVGEKTADGCAAPGDDTLEEGQVESKEESKKEESKENKALDESNEAPVCAVCMEGDGENDRVLLETHHCPQCKPTAWRICDVCNENLLSRVCPVCRSKYAAQILHQWPSKSEIDAAALPEPPCSTMLRKLIASSNIAIYTSSSGKLRFSLPRDPTLPAHRREYVQATLTVGADRVEGGRFVFDNDVWEELCGEDGDEPTTGDRPSGAVDLQVRKATEGMAWVNAAMRDEGAFALTQMEKPLEMLRQLASEVTTAAGKS
eukprot:271416-Rhodomonas_salina.1